MEYREPTPSVLLLHDGELADLAAVVEPLGGIDRRSHPTESDRTRAWDVIIASASRMLEIDQYIFDHSAVRIAVLDGDSKTLRKMLRRVDTDLMVRQPVHPAALRLLILHALYRGPEKRRNTRVSVGAPVRFRAGWRRRPAILAELSTRGCRLMVNEGRHRAAPGRLVTVILPPEITNDGHPLSLRGHVMRVASSEPGDAAIAVLFELLRDAAHERLESIVAAHSHGPAVLEEAVARPVEATPTARDAAEPEPAEPSDTEPEPIAFDAAEPEPAEPSDTEPEPIAFDAAEPEPAEPSETDAEPIAFDAAEPEPAEPSDTEPEPSAVGEDAPSPPAPAEADAPSTALADAAAETDGERRTRDRHAMKRRIIALGHEAARVLIGRDLSVGGMRIDPTPGLALGDHLKVAVHVRPDGQPLVVSAEIVRDDGPNGMALRFAELSPAAQRYLSQMIDALPNIIEWDGSRGGAGLVVSELVARRAGERRVSR